MESDLKPYMKNDEIHKLIEYLFNATNYYEFGSGGSTLLACKMNVPNITTVEYDLEWYNKLKQNQFINKKIENNTLEIKLFNLNCVWWEYVSWASTPKSIENVNKEDWERYSCSIFECERTQDLILVDGRFRVNCALNSYYKMDSNSYLLFHDYTIRPQYHIIEKFFNLVDNQDTLSIFQKKSNIDELELLECIDKYKYFID